MITILSIVLLGFFLGMRHATDADHVIAVTTIVSRERTLKVAAWVGALWGIGHTLTILVVGIPIILFSVVVPPRVGLGMEFSVALMLILLGVLNLVVVVRSIRDARVLATTGAGVSHTHAHQHGDYVHHHPHGHGPEHHPHRADDTPLARLDRRFDRLAAYRMLRPLVVGVVHGLAGSAAIALLVLTTIRSPTWAIVYLLVFGLGTVAGMMLVTIALAVPFAYSNERFAATNRSLRMATGLLSLGFGLFLAYQIGVVDGLFTSNPRWTPH
jgi:high-affinity nickel-transport protein